jgi:hypothetical protein
VNLSAGFDDFSVGLSTCVETGSAEAKRRMETGDVRTTSIEGALRSFSPRAATRTVDLEYMMG